MLFFIASLFFSCDLDTSKIKDSVNSATQDLTGNAENTPTSADIEVIDLATCDTQIDNRHGCTCSFKDAKGNGSNIFLSNMDNHSKSACLSINGKTEIVTGQRIDARHDHVRHSYIPDWIVLDPSGEVHIFNELVDDANYEVNKALIVETMLVMHNLPEKIKLRKNKGSKGEEVSAEMANKYEKMWSESYKLATDERAKGNHGAPLEIELTNEMFNVYVKGDVEKHNEDGSDNYYGTIEIKSKSGKLLGSRDFTGICQCKD